MRAGRTNARAAVGVAIAIAIALGPVLLHLVTPGLQMLVDWHLHACWMLGFTDALREGVADPQWISRANGGFGAPVFLFYPSLAYYLAAPFVVVGGPTFAFKSLSLMAVFIAALGMFAWLRLSLRGPLVWAGVAVSMLLPQLLWPMLRFNMPAQTLGLSLVPFVFAAWEHCVIQRRGGAMWLSLATAAVFATHLPTALMTGTALGVLSVASIAGTRRLAAAFSGIAAVLLGIALSARAWLTPLLEAGNVHLEHLKSPQWLIGDNLLFSGSALLAFPHEGFAMEIVALTTMAILIGAYLIARLVRRGHVAPDAAPPRVWLLLAVVCFVMGTTLAEPLYRMLPPLDLLQFGWRWQGLFALVAVRVTLPLLPEIGMALAPRVRRALGGLFAGLCIAALCAAAIGLTTGLALLELPRVERALDTRVDWASRTCPWDTFEHRPQTMGQGWERDLRSDRSADVAFVRGRGYVIDSDLGSHRREYVLQADFDSKLRLRLLHYPGWRATLDEAPHPLTHDRSGATTLELPAGRHRLVLGFDDNRGAARGRMISLTAWLTLIAIAARQLRARRKITAAAATP